MMFSALKRLARWFLERPLVRSPGLARKWLTEHKNEIDLVTSPRALEALNLDDIEPTLVDPPIEVRELDAMHHKFQKKWIVAAGGGRVMDAGKYLAWRRRKHFCAIPTILSTTSWLNMAIALREDGRLVFPASKHTRTIIIDQALVLKAPASYTLGGLADLLAAASAMTDWQLSGAKVPPRAADAFSEVVNRILKSMGELNPFTRDSVDRIADYFLEVLSLCGAARSGRPVEGSEHHMYYYLEEELGKRFVHGQIVALTTIIALKLQEDKAMLPPGKLIEFYDFLGLPFRPRDNGLEVPDLLGMLDELPAFVERRHLPGSIITRGFDKEAAGNFIRTLDG